MDIWDRALPGFGIRLSQGGGKTWVVMARRGNRRVRLTLGPYPDLSLDAARAQALTYLSLRPAEVSAANRPDRMADARAPSVPRDGRPALTPDLIATARRALLLLQTVLDAEPALDGLAPTVPADAGEAPLAEEPAEAGRRRILLVEDTETNRMVALAMLALEPYDIDTANDGREAVEAAKAVPYDLILMDVSMPVMDGIEATRAIRALPGPAAKAPIIAMTAHAMTADRERCLAAGMNDYVSKPVSRPELIEKIGAHLATRAAAKSDARARPAVLDPEVIRQLQIDLRSDSLAAFIDSLLPDIRTRLHGIAAARVTGSLTAIAAHAHSLVGLAATFGAHGLEERARAIEERARVGAAEGLPALVDQLKPVADEAVAALTALRGRSA